MWRQDGTKLTGNYGTWRGQEVEFWSLKPYEGMLTIIDKGKASPGPEWHVDAGDPSAHTLEVPADEVTNRHKVRVTGSLGPGRNFVIMEESADGKLSVESIDPMDSMYKRQLINNHDFIPFSKNEPLEHVSVGGWLPADRFRDIHVEIRPVSSD